MSFERFSVALLAFLMLAAVASCFYVFQHAVQNYRREQLVRLEPVGERYFEEKPQSKQFGQQRVLLFGDSGWSRWVPYPKWDGVQVINRGIGGETAIQTLLRIERDGLELKPDVVLIQTGGNDLKAIGVLPEREGEIVDDCYRNIAEMARRFVEAGSHVIVTTIFPLGPIEWKRRPIWSDRINEAVDRLNERLTDLQSEQVTVVDLDTYFRDGKYIDPQYAADSMHLNERGYKILHQRLAELLAGLASPDEK